MTTPPDPPQPHPAATLLEELANAAHNGVTFPEPAELPVLETAARQLEFFVARIAVGVSKTSMLEALATGLQFPAHFGRNWDALTDCLNDLSWLPAQGYLLVLETGELWSTTTREAVEMLVEVCGEAAASWGERGTPFRVAVVIPPGDHPW